MTPLIGFQQKKLKNRLFFITVERKSAILQMQHTFSVLDIKWCRTSTGLISTLQPILLPGGGGLNLTVCQFVEFIFSKWSVSFSSPIFSCSAYTAKGSRINRCATCFASWSSIPKKVRAHWKVGFFLEFLEYGTLWRQNNIRDLRNVSHKSLKCFRFWKFCSEM